MSLSLQKWRFDIAKHLLLNRKIPNERINLKSSNLISIEIFLTRLLASIASVMIFIELSFLLRRRFHLVL